MSTVTSKKEGFEKGLEIGDKVRSVRSDVRSSAAFLVLGAFLFLFNQILGGLMAFLGLFGIVLTIATFFSKSKYIIVLKSMESLGVAILFLLIVFEFSVFEQEYLTSLSFQNPLISIALSIFSLYKAYSYFRSFRSEI